MKQKSLIKKIDLKKSILLIGIMMLSLFCFIACGKDDKTSDSNSQKDIQKEEKKELQEEQVEDIIPKDFAYAVTVSINPSAMLYFDKQDVIVGIAYLNEDAKDAYKDAEFIGKTMDAGVALMVNLAAEKSYLKTDATISFELSEVKDTDYITDASVLEQMESIAIQQVESYEDEYHIEVQQLVKEEVTAKTNIKPLEICPTCNGAGRWCDECKGTTIVHCKSCHDTGYEDCGNCNGTGLDHGATCTFCGGGKNHICTWCHGSLQHTCPICEGAPGTCPTCGGNGTI